MAEPDKGPLRSESLNAGHRAAYDRVSARYALVNAEMPAQVVGSAGRFLASVGAGGVVLDLGCGHGRDMTWFEARGVRVVGADLSTGMLAEASHHVCGPLLQMDMRVPPLRDGTFRGVWCNAAILHLPKAEVLPTLGEIRRLLQPGGVLFVSVQVGTGETWEAVGYQQPISRFFARYEPEEFADFLRQAGFTVVNQDDSRASATRHWAHFLGGRDD